MARADENVPSCFPLKGAVKSATPVAWGLQSQMSRWRGCKDHAHPSGSGAAVSVLVRPEAYPSPLSCDHPWPLCGWESMSGRFWPGEELLAGQGR